MIPHDPPTGDQWTYSEFMELYAQFRTRQLQRQDWVPFNRIANWSAREKGTGRINDKHLTDVYRDLLSGLRLGEFDHEGRCTVHYLWFDKKDYVARLAGSWLIDAVDECLKRCADIREVVVPAYLVPCWMPRDVLLRWCENNKYSPHPAWLETPELWPDTVGNQIDDQPERLTPKEELIRKAVEVKFPDGVPSHLQKQDRNNILIERIKKDGSNPPSDKTFRRYFQKFKYQTNGH